MADALIWTMPVVAMLVKAIAILPGFHLMIYFAVANICNYAIGTNGRMYEPIQSLDTIIRQQGYRLTPQRQLILDAIRQAGGHCTPEEVYRQVQSKTTAINRATVYRTLEFFLELGLVTVAHAKENRVIYELAGQTPHHHLVCQRCDHIEPLPHALVQPFFDSLASHFDFQVNTDHLMLFGLCAQCRTIQAA
jgi:Fur family transcriptional regulator, ferric uptake regulator